MRVLLAATTLMVLAVPVTAQASLPTVPDGPELSLWDFQKGTLLYWQDDSPAVAAEVWRYSHEGLAPAWELLAAGPGLTWYWDAAAAAYNPDTTWYAVVVTYEDGTRAVSNPATSGQYPHCDWLFLNIPPQLRPECTLPPPWPYELVAGTIEKIAPV